jgi:hypothetical protein
MAACPQLAKADIAANGGITWKRTARRIAADLCLRVGFALAGACERAARTPQELSAAPGGAGGNFSRVRARVRNGECWSPFLSLRSYAEIRDNTRVFAPTCVHSRVRLDNHAARG